MSVESCQVTVIGAGISGLATTTALVSAGVDVVCLEARDRVGGRLLSVQHDGGALDLGATWFWAGEQRVQRLLDDLGRSPFPQWTAGDGLYEPGGAV